mmetsp:Transcript_83623/g.165963  ORF Transcript_83623/g.165963 Transcript_83623/m.165963 type:complete len:224 (-) Transcript_83623:489-1160(-)
MITYETSKCSRRVAQSLSPLGRAHATTIREHNMLTNKIITKLREVLNTEGTCCSTPANGRSGELRRESFVVIGLETTPVPAAPAFRFGCCPAKLLGGGTWEKRGPSFSFHAFIKLLSTTSPMSSWISYERPRASRATCWRSRATFAGGIFRSCVTALSEWGSSRTEKVLQSGKCHGQSFSWAGRNKTGMQPKTIASMMPLREGVSPLGSKQNVALSMRETKRS